MKLYRAFLVGLFVLAPAIATGADTGSFFSKISDKLKNVLDSTRGGAKEEEPATHSLPTQVLVAAYTNEGAADEAAEVLKEAMLAGLLYYKNIAVVRKGMDSKVKVREAGQIELSDAAMSGAFVGGALGILAGPAGVAAGAATGALLSGYAASSMETLDEKKLDEVYVVGGGVLKKGTSAIIVVLEDVQVDKKTIKAVEADRRVLVYQLARDIHSTFKKGEDAAYLFTLTEDGIMMTRMAAGDDAANLKGMLVTKHGVAVGQAGTGVDKEIVYEAYVASKEGAAYQAGHTEKGKVVVDDEAKAEF